mgnify:CR=1 FL=1
MRKLLALFWKDTRLRFAGRSELLFFLILPIVFTFILAGGTGRGDDGRIPVLVVDEAHSALSRQILSELGRSPSLRVEWTTPAAGEAALKQRRAAALLVIPAESHPERLRTGTVALVWRQRPDDLGAQAAAQAVRAVLYRLGSALVIAHQAVTTAASIRPFATTAEREAYFDEALAAAQRRMATAPQRLEVVIANTTGRVGYDPAAQASAGQLITWVFIPLLGLAAVFVQERQGGTLRRLVITPTRRGMLLLGTIGGHVFWALVQMGLLMGFGVWVLGVPWAREPLALVMVMVAAALAAAALGTMMATFVKTTAQATGLSILLGMVMALLGGCWYPLELFPRPVQMAVHGLPTTWAMQGMLDMLVRGQGPAGVLPETAVLLGFAAVCFAVGSRRFRYAS